MNTVGKAGQLGAQIRCVVSVSMLTEGWDANNVTHILGIRAFGTQLLCEQVIGRALRRQCYELNEEDPPRFDAEYADIFGIPFDFTAQPVATDSSTCFLISTLLLRALSRNQVSKKTLGRRITASSSGEPGSPPGCSGNLTTGTLGVDGAVTSFHIYGDFY